ncbi:helix-turn-helix domain-containing protein [Staphylococcus equorum]|uniref:helix-turn-helix domain-containing protein n=1 Tax=Staphylococcus equorum TaxID=246432 RepID=UPI00255548A0|nr:helix-turn-helix transcriptional regulator [Staphylococcus equorum]MDK9867838.1 helix-turn-helix transcriptional regulator [Staphylococcus equorum]
MELNSIVSKNIKHYMVESKITTTQISKETKLARSSLTAVIKGQATMIRFETIEKLANYFDIEPYELFREKNFKDL